jgi:2-iminoacetate synthase ThiH
LICAWRIYNEEIELSISTRENELFRDHIIKLGATTMSAGSKTNPGGYAVEPESLEQFEIDDSRSVEAVQKMIERSGYKAVWKDWEQFTYTDEEIDMLEKRTESYMRGETKGYTVEESHKAIREQRKNK